VGFNFSLVFNRIEYRNENSSISERPIYVKNAQLYCRSKIIFERNLQGHCKSKNYNKELSSPSFHYLEHRKYEGTASAVVKLVAEINIPSPLP